MIASMFNPTRDQARRFFIEAWRKRRQGLPATALETQAAAIALQHPEYQGLLEDDGAIERDWSPEDGQTNPFLHLSLHLALEEQLAIDQPPGIRAALTSLQDKLDDRHRALHAAIECLAETLWRAQRDHAPLDAAAYLDCLRRGRDG